VSRYENEGTSGWWVWIFVILFAIGAIQLANSAPSGSDDCIHSMAQMGC